MWEDLKTLQYIFQNCSVWNRLCLLLAENLVLFQTTFEPLVFHELWLFLRFWSDFLIDFF